MNKKRVENRWKRHYEKQELQREVKKVVEGEEYEEKEYIPKKPFYRRIFSGTG